MARWWKAKLDADFTTSSATAVDVTGLSFVPAPNIEYEFSGMLYLRVAVATVGARPGLAWPTGLDDGVAHIWIPNSATGQINVFGNIQASLLMAAGGFPLTTQSYLGQVRGMVKAGSSPSGAVKMQLASETAATNVTMKVGSFLKWRIV